MASATWSLTLRSLGVAALLLVAASGVAQAAGWKAGVAKENITPEKPMWMSGYAARNHPAEGKLTDLWAKALVIEDPQGHRVALVTMDLVGIDRDVSLAVRDGIESKYGLKRADVALNVSHTHCGPVVGRNLMPIYSLDDVQLQLVRDYTRQLEQKLIAVVGAALAKSAPCELSWGNGHADFAVNRRNNKEADVPALREKQELKGPFDHDVPVLAVKDAEGKLMAVAVGYACHSTTLGFYQWCGDYPGFATAELEKNHPGALALFWAGCGADQNPLPRKTVELAESYGHRLAVAVDEVLARPMNRLSGNLTTSYAEVDLPLAALPSREELESRRASKNKYEVSRANMLLAQIDAGKPLSQTYPYPVQVWHLGPELRWAFLGGEVVVDFALRLKQELGPGTTWVAGYSNDVMAYIPSRRVLLEGGYEGATAMIYYGLPTSWAPEVEEVIVKQVHQLAK
jgi:hypothetical protein